MPRLWMEKLFGVTFWKWLWVLTTFWAFYVSTVSRFPLFVVILIWVVYKENRQTERRQNEQITSRSESL
jgi:ABC-type amino acid transport system permease subunit